MYCYCYYFVCGSVCGADEFLCGLLRRLFMRCSSVRLDSNLGEILCISFWGLSLCVVISLDLCSSDVLGGGCVAPA